MTDHDTDFKQAQAARYREWLAALQTWIFGSVEQARTISPYLIFIHSSENNPETYVLPHLDNLRIINDFVQGRGAAVGTYRGAEIWVIHHCMGCTATQRWMESLTGTPVRYLVSLAEMTAYPDHVHIGDIVLPTVSSRGDLVTNFHMPPEIPATGDIELLGRLADKLKPSDWPVHLGPIYSGLPGGTGPFDLKLREDIWRRMQAGLLGNAIETSTVYVEAIRLGIHAAEAWAVSDDLAYGILDDYPDGREKWAGAWSRMAEAALDVLADIAEEEKQE